MLQTIEALKDFTVFVQIFTPEGLSNQEMAEALQIFKNIQKQW